MMKIIRNFARLVVGITFVFSGFVKVIDPLGSAYKFADYFTAMHLDFMIDGALFFAIIMSAAELVIGIALVFNLIPKLASLGVLLFMSFFTPLTLWLAVANPVSDCGCFGDAIILTNWQTFYKNIVLLILAIIIFVYRSKYKSNYQPAFQWILVSLSIIISVGLSIYCLRNLPIIDFRPYHIGANISESMTIPENQKDNKDIYESVFIYENNGVKKEFKDTELPTDTTWKFVDAVHKLVKEGYKPPIHDFTIEPVYIQGYSPEYQESINMLEAEFVYTNSKDTTVFYVDKLPNNNQWRLLSVNCNGVALNQNLININYVSANGISENFNLKNLPDSSYHFIDASYHEIDNDYTDSYGEDIANKILAEKNYSFFVIMTTLDKANDKYIDKITEIANFCKEKSYNFYCLTASNEAEISEFIKKYNVNYKFYNTDPITLKTIVRSNPGLMLVKNATIINKWAGKNIPTVSELENDLLAMSISEQQNKLSNYVSIIYLIGTLLFVSLFSLLYNWLKQNKFINTL